MSLILKLANKTLKKPISQIDLGLVKENKSLRK